MGFFATLGSAVVDSINSSFEKSRFISSYIEEEIKKILKYTQMQSLDWE